MSKYAVLIAVSKAKPSAGDTVETKLVVEVDTIERAREIAKALHSGAITSIENLKAQGWSLT